MPKSDDIETLRRRKSFNVPQQVAVSRDVIRREAVWWRNNPVPAALRSVFADHDLEIDRGIFIDVSDREHEQDCTFGTFVTHDGRFIEFDIDLSSDGETLLSVNDFRDITESLDICGRKPGIGATRPFLALEVLREINGG